MSLVRNQGKRGTKELAFARILAQNKTMKSSLRTLQEFQARKDSPEQPDSRQGGFSFTMSIIKTLHFTETMPSPKGVRALEDYRPYKNAVLRARCNRKNMVLDTLKECASREWTLVEKIKWPIEDETTEIVTVARQLGNSY